MDNYTKEQPPLMENLEKIKLPAVQTPIYKQKLKSVLISQARLAGQPAARDSLLERLFGLFAPRRRIAFSLSIAAVFLLVAAWLLFTPAPQIYAHLVLELNPAVRLSIDTRGRVAGFEALDPKAQEIVRTADLRNKRLPQAVAEIVDELYGQGLLTPDRKMLLLIYPAADAVPQDQLTATLGKAHTAASRRLQELDIRIAIQQSTMEAEIYQAAEREGLRPSQYLRLLDHNVSSGVLLELFRAGRESGLGKNIFANRFSAIADLVAEMLEAGVSEKEALQIVKELLAAGAGIELLEEALSRLLKNLEEGKSPAHAINQLREAIKSGRIDKAIGQDDDDTDDDHKDEDKDDQDTLEKDQGDLNDDAEESKNQEDRDGQRLPNEDDGEVVEEGEEVEEYEEDPGHEEDSETMSSDEAENNMVLQYGIM